jgi:hypothetical protein
VTGAGAAALGVDSHRRCNGLDDCRFAAAVLTDEKGHSRRELKALFE